MHLRAPAGSKAFPDERPGEKVSHGHLLVIRCSHRGRRRHILAAKHRADRSRTPNEDKCVHTGLIHCSRQNNKALITGDQNLELLETESHGAPDRQRERERERARRERERAQSYADDSLITVIAKAKRRHFSGPT